MPLLLFSQSLLDSPFSLPLCSPWREYKYQVIGLATWIAVNGMSE
jgi:hypothetical protein